MRALSIIAILFASTSSAMAAGPAASARALAERALAHFERHGEAALEAFTHDPAWRDGDLYVFVLNEDGVMLAHGFKPPLVGADVSTLRDVRGFAIFDAIVAIEDEGVISYYWPRPLSENVEPKRTVVLARGDLRFAVGYYED